MTPDDQYGKPWTHSELVLALYLYCQIPFAKTTAKNAEVIRLASLLHRTPASVARKLGNFGAFDPLLAQKGIVGLTHYSKADKQTWDEFNGHWSELVEESNTLLQQIGGVGPDAQEAEAGEKDIQKDILEAKVPVGPSEKQRLVMARLHQTFFRRVILSSYQSTCCVCQLDVPDLLVASHIIPWSKQADKRTDPHNGLCLCSLHDKAFDTGLMSVKPNLEIALSTRLSESKNEFVESSLKRYSTGKIMLPVRFRPSEESLQWHLTNVFQHNA